MKILKNSIFSYVEVTRLYCYIIHINMSLIIMLKVNTDIHYVNIFRLHKFSNNLYPLHIIVLSSPWERSSSHSNRGQLIKTYAAKNFK